MRQLRDARGRLRRRLLDGKFWRRNGNAERLEDCPRGAFAYDAVRAECQLLAVLATTVGVRTS